MQLVSWFWSIRYCSLFVTKLVSQDESCAVVSTVYFQVNCNNVAACIMIWVYNPTHILTRVSADFVPTVGGQTIPGPTFTFTALNQMIYHLNYVYLVLQRKNVTYFHNPENVIYWKQRYNGYNTCFVFRKSWFSSRPGDMQSWLE
jgi:hypothetical protein